MTEHDLQEGFAETIAAINILPTEEERRQFRRLAYVAFVETLRIMEEYSFQRMLIEKIEASLHTRNMN